MVGAALMLSVSAYYVLRRRHMELAAANFKTVMPFFVIFVSFVVRFLLASP